MLVEVTAAGVNNTDINTRIGWYSKSVTSDTNAGGAGGFDDVDTDDASWSGAPLVFPRIQGLIAAAILQRWVQVSMKAGSARGCCPGHDE